jgi:hypothetical protein
MARNKIRGLRETWYGPLPVHIFTPLTGTLAESILRKPQYHWPRILGALILLASCIHDMGVNIAYVPFLCRDFLMPSRMITFLLAFLVLVIQSLAGRIKIFVMVVGGAILISTLSCILAERAMRLAQRIWAIYRGSIILGSLGGTFQSLGSRMMENILATW